MALVLCKRARIIHMAIPRRFAPTRDGLFTSTMHLTFNSCQFYSSPLQFKGLNSQNTNRMLLQRRASLHNEGSTSIPASSLLVDCSPVLTMCGFPCMPFTWYTPRCKGASSLFNNQPVPIGSLYTTDRVGCVFTQQFKSIVDKVAKYLPKWPLSPTVLVWNTTETILHGH